MKIVEYNNSSDVIVEFQDEHKTRVHTKYMHYKSGMVRNPYAASVCNVGAVGTKYSVHDDDGNIRKEYSVWTGILQRCYSKETQKKCPTYMGVTVCDDWLLYENFYEWVHKQNNFDKWFNGNMWAVDKDILLKGNKVYSPETCCLVPFGVNVLFAKRNALRGCLPIGVSRNGNLFEAYCKNPFTNKKEHIGNYDCPISAFYAYKNCKEDFIKQVAKKEFNAGNITKQCYDAMMNYEVEITD